MSITTHVMSDEGAARSELLPLAVLVGAVLLFGIWATATGNFDMSWASGGLLIGP